MKISTKTDGLERSAQPSDAVRPYWIRVGLTDATFMFEGHQGHWAECYFSNAYIAAIKHALENKQDVFDEIDDGDFEIREMTDEELAKYPEALDFQRELIELYGEY